jgi:hypothetical protein
LPPRTVVPPICSFVLRQFANFSGILS